MDKMRERFEAAIKRPPGVFWNEASGEYDGSQSYYAQLAETYQAAWDAWQAALSQAEPVEKTFGEGIDVSYQDLFSQWQADHELQLKTEKPAPLPQPVASDVEEFIADCSHTWSKDIPIVPRIILDEDLRAWMAGHRRVPDLALVLVQAAQGSMALGRDGDARWQIDDAIKLLTASKEKNNAE